MDTIVGFEKPAHVPDAAVYDFDIYRDAALNTDPHERIRQMLREAPEVFWTPRNHGHWVVFSHAANFEAGRNWEAFSNEIPPKAEAERMLAALPPGTPHIVQCKPINLDPPDHTNHRAPLLSVFSPRTVKALTNDIRALADSLIDKVIDQGRCNFIAAIAEPMPVTVFLKMMGLPLDRLAEFRILVHEMLAPNPSGNHMEHVRRMRKVADAMMDVIVARRLAPQDDIISNLWQAQVGGQPVTYEMMEDFCVLLFVAGLDTVINGMGFGIRHLAGDPAMQTRLRAEPGMMGEAMEELLRRYTFVATQRRMAKDAVIAGQTLKEGDWVTLYWPAADLDPRRFAEPERCDIDREDKAHLAFGAGPHRCIGSHLARIEMQIIYEQILKRLPPFRLDPDKPATFRTGNIIAMESLHILWN